MIINNIIRKCILIFGDTICLYVATIAAIYIENGQITLFKGDFHLRFLILLIVLLGLFFRLCHNKWLILTRNSV